MKNTINIFSETGCIPHEMLWKYRQGKLTAAEKHAVEVHLTDCELCSDALAGMMNMKTDEVIVGLRKSIRNISAPKKVVRFYDYRIVSAAAAAALLIVFTYVINSSDKPDKKEIAQLVAPEEPKKNEQITSLSESPPETADTLATQTAFRTKEKTVASNAVSSSPPPVTQEDFASVEDAGKQEETIVLKDVANENVATAEAEPEYTAPAQTAAGAASRYGDKAPPPSAKSESKKKSEKDESSKIAYINDLKVARTPAMTETEKFDSVNTGTPAMNENVYQQSAEAPAREMPFVYSKTLRDGMNYFHAKRYRDASQTFSIILERLPNDVNSQFYKGVSEMEMQNYSPSASLLNQAMLNPDKTFYEEAKFKLALCYVALNKKSKAEKLLREIAEEKGFYSEKATHELEQLK